MDDPVGRSWRNGTIELPKTSGRRKDVARHPNGNEVVPEDFSRALERGWSCRPVSRVDTSSRKLLAFPVHGKVVATYSGECFVRRGTLGITWV